MSLKGVRVLIPDRTLSGHKRVTMTRLPFNCFQQPTHLDLEN
jgi:hypothetical protein